MFAVLKKEFKSYLLSPIGYIFIGIFLLTFSIFFQNIFGLGMVNFEFLFYDGATILTFIVPVLTMRMFSEERKNGTEQLLLTSPRGITSIVLGKFLAATCIILVAELLTLIYYFILVYFGKPSLMIALTTLLGFLLLSLAYISLGMFISTITENQIVCCVISIGIFLSMWFLPNNLFSILYSFVQNFPMGLIPLADIIKFISFILLFISLTIVSLSNTSIQ